MNDMIRLENGRLRARCGELYLPSYDGYSDPLLQRCAAERPADVAAAAQRHSEDLLVAIAREHVARTGCANLCLAGGVFGNVKLNQRLREIPGVRDVYVLPCMGDGGLALARRWRWPIARTVRASRRRAWPSGRTRAAPRRMPS